jgi:RIO kinase 1
MELYPSSDFDDPDLPHHPLGPLTDGWDDDQPSRRRRDRGPGGRSPRGSRRTTRADLEGPRRPDADQGSVPDAAASGTEPEPDAEPRWSSWLGALHGPEPFPDWLVTELGATDTDFGTLKTGKEADVHLIERGVPGDRSCLLAAKRYRTAEHRMFHRDAGYLEGRRVRRSRETRAMARRTDFGRDLIAGQWAAAEFDALSRLWQLGRRTGTLRVPYPAQLAGTELLMEFIGEPDGRAAPRLAELRPSGAELDDLWQQALDLLGALSLAGLAHGDLSPYNVLVHRGELVLIDLPQVVDVVANPRGPSFLARDVAVMAGWFTARGVPAAAADPLPLTSQFLAEAGLG